MIVAAITNRSAKESGVADIIEVNSWPQYLYKYQFLGKIKLWIIFM